VGVLTYSHALKILFWVVAKKWMSTISKKIWSHIFEKIFLKSFARGQKLQKLSFKLFKILQLFNDFLNSSTQQIKKKHFKEVSVVK
jgi:hypothetical protein